MKELLTFALACPGVIATPLIAVALIALWFPAREEARERVEILLAFTLLAEPAGMIAEAFAAFLSRFVPVKLDLYIYRIDRLFDLPGFHIAHYVYAHPWAAIVLSLTYGLLPIAALGATAVNLYLAERQRTYRMLWAFVANMFLAVPVYLCVPVCGPAFAFQRFPDIPVDIIPHGIAINAAPNGIPSVHMSTAILIWWFLKRWPWGNVAGIVFMVLIVLATLGSGQHYCFDLLCAVPFSALVLWLTQERQVSAVPAPALEQP